MKTAIMVNGEVNITEDEEIINTNRLATFDELLEQISYGYNEVEEDLVRVREGYAVIDDNVGVEMVLNLE